MHLHAERERCVIALGDQLSADNRICEKMRVQIAYTSVTLDEANARADIASSTTQLTRGKLRTFAKVAAYDETVLLVALEERRRAKQVLGSEGHST